MGNRTAEIGISAEILSTVLGIPDSVEILASSFDHGTHSLRLIVSHPAFDEVAEGQLPPRATVPTSEVGSLDRLRWVRARMVQGSICVNGADVVLIETFIVRKG